ncbi:hypothetical protein V496_00646 [Pseudogymnoascus sp. VKM F-4515 (FW-2607)]|nr:hypothetical protein V496_00646 [Pseudogymnoascus sp. VKM F-4515 (FW-2607)]
MLSASQGSTAATRGIQGPPSTSLIWPTCSTVSSRRSFRIPVCKHRYMRPCHNHVETLPPSAMTTAPVLVVDVSQIPLPASAL